MTPERTREINWGGVEDEERAAANAAAQPRQARAKLARLITPAGERLRGLRVTQQQAEAYCKRHRGWTWA